MQSELKKSYLCNERFCDPAASAHISGMPCLSVHWRRFRNWQQLRGVVSLHKEDPHVSDNWCANWWTAISSRNSCKQKLLNRLLIYWKLVLT